MTVVGIIGLWVLVGTTISLVARYVVQSDPEGWWVMRVVNAYSHRKVPEWSDDVVMGWVWVAPVLWPFSLFFFLSCYVSGRAAAKREARIEGMERIKKYREEI